MRERERMQRNGWKNIHRSRNIDKEEEEEEPRQKEIPKWII